jgi:hypothetical protein
MDERKKLLMKATAHPGLSADDDDDETTTMTMNVLTPCMPVVICQRYTAFFYMVSLDVAHGIWVGSQNIGQNSLLFFNPVLTVRITVFYAVKMSFVCRRRHQRLLSSSSSLRQVVLFKKMRDPWPISYETVHYSAQIRRVYLTLHLCSAISLPNSV